MKKLFLLFQLTIAVSYSYGQNINLGNETFNYNGQAVHHYGLGWYNDQATTAYGPMAYLSAFGGTRFFSGGILAATLDVNCNFGIGTDSPTQKLDVVGNVLLRNMTNAPGAGTSISFSSYNVANPGPKISSYLDYADGGASSSRLILSSFSSGYKNELTLVNGRVGIGTSNPKEELSVNGNIWSKQIMVETNNWPDYVFDDTYNLGSLENLGKYLSKNKHLPDMPSAKEIYTQGQNLGEVNSKLLKNLEELTLHLIEKDREIQQQQRKLDLQQSDIEQIKIQLKLLQDQIKK